MSWPQRVGRRPWIYGHRGVAAKVTENTIESFQLALDEGADGVELDVRLNCFGELIVFHDDTLERMTLGRDRREIYEMSAKEAVLVPLADGGSIPTLIDVLAWAHTNTSWLNIELKPRREDAEMLADAVLRAMRDHALPALQSRMLLSSFSETAVSVLLARQSMIPIALLMEPGSRVPVSLRESTRLGVHPHHSMLISGSAWDLGNPPFVNTWTVNDTRAVQRVNFANVDGIITDDPLTLRNALE